MTSSQNPRKWRYTYEAQSHLPILKLYLFDQSENPNCDFTNFNVDLQFEKSLIQFNWIESKCPISISIPLPRVLVDLDQVVNFRVLDDHIDVKIPLLLSVDHPIVSSFIAELNAGDDFGRVCSSDQFLEPLSMESDFKSLSSKGDVDFYCRNCSFKLTKAPIRCLGELPSVNWTDVADNWFGSCCCSFGGISEKLVAKYVKSYRCTEGTCLLTTASIILSKDDVLGFEPPAIDPAIKSDVDCSIDNPPNTDNAVDAHVNCSTEGTTEHDSSAKLGLMRSEAQNGHINGLHTELKDDSGQKSPWTKTEPNVSKDAPPEHHFCSHDSPNSFMEDQVVDAPINLKEDQKSFLNCYLGNDFFFRSSGLSKDIEWINFACSQCSSILGAFPSADGSEPLDGGIRLLKCFITISPSRDLTSDLFSKYTLERMFSCQLIESAKDELSFRTVVKDLKTKSPMLHIVLLNPNSWCCTGHCFEGTCEQLVKIHLQPAVKVLFSQCNDVKLDTRSTEEWEMKNQADEVYMLTDVIRELIKSLDRGKNMFPLSFSSSQTSILSSMLR